MSSSTPPLQMDIGGGRSLTEMRPEDQPALARQLNDRDIYRWTLRIPHPYTDEDARQFLENVAETAATRGHPLHFAIRESGGGLIGGVGFEGLVYDHRAEIGYWLAKPWWGRGVMTAAVGAACQHAAEQWRLVRIVAHVFADNQASARVLEKNGFELEGQLRKHHRKDGQLIDAKLYARVG